MLGRLYRSVSLTKGAFIQQKWTQKNETLVRNVVRHSSTLDKQAKLTGAQLSKQRPNILEVNVDRKTYQFPVVWLRDNCLCPKCFEPKSNGRIIDLQEFQTNIKITNIEVNSDKIKLSWDDGHQSVFEKQWLLDRSFEQDDREQRIRNRHPEKKAWDAENFVCKKFAFGDIMEIDSTLLDWLETLAETGVSIIKDTPQDPKHVENLAARIAFQRRTLYGTVFHVKNVKDTYNLAYRVGPLQFHSDIPHFIHIPGANLLHCMIQSTDGGENTLCDGLTAIKQLPPRIHTILSNTLVDWVDKGQQDNIDFHVINRAPVVCQDVKGKLTRINWNQGIRDSYFNINIEDVDDWYEAMKVFSNVIHDPRNMVTLKTTPGDILTFDNTRLVHGRLDYRDGDRHVIGAYMDWDEMYSRIRILRTKLRNINM